MATINALLPTTNSEANAKSRALKAAQQAQTLAGQGSHEAAIAAWIDAADELLRIDTVDAQTARTAVARAIEGSELALMRQQTTRIQSRPLAVLLPLAPKVAAELFEPQLVSTQLPLVAKLRTFSLAFR